MISVESEPSRKKLSKRKMMKYKSGEITDHNN